MPSNGRAVPRTIPPLTASGKFTTSTTAIISIVLFTPPTIPLSLLNTAPHHPLAPAIAAALMSPPREPMLIDTYAAARAAVPRPAPSSFDTRTDAAVARDSMTENSR
ncbi:hypothetical protein IEQ34_006272 [Dendrobium chrysotoxum]|uniref:Uncharacterized protein n=1 Tax=Dendrobium chrysotoxum TaxID=161865 RepID=A0AAV7GXD1_DENCH|nr:hypothetical protein IEQ34_006272 [Dendrobium chrysotoxum]